MNGELDVLGQLMTRELRAQALGEAEWLLEGRSKAPELARVQSVLSGLSEAQRAAVRELVRVAVDTGVHDFLFGLHAAAEDSGLDVVQGGESLIADSDGLHGEPFGANGWFARLSEWSS